MSAPVPDFRDLIAGLERLSEQWAAESSRMSQALDAAAVQVTRPGFSLSVAHGRITALRFTDQGLRIGPVQLREQVLAAYAEAAAASNGASSAAVSSVFGDPALAAGVRAGLPEQVRPSEDTAPADAAARHTPPDTAGAGARHTESIEDWLADPALDEEPVFADLDRTMADVEGWEQYRDLGDPAMWQYDLEQTVARLSRRAGELRERLTQLTARAESPTLVVEVNAGGGLVDVRLRPGAERLTPERLTEEFLSLYHQAATDAGAATSELVRDGGAAEDDPTLGVFSPAAPSFAAPPDEPASR